MKRTLVTVAAVLFLAGCGASVPASGPQPSVGKYQQTWATGYGSTTCADWSGKMDDHQRFVAAADMLAATRKGWNVATLPSDSLIIRLQKQVTADCLNPSATIALVATVDMTINGSQATYSK